MNPLPRGVGGHLSREPLRNEISRESLWNVRDRSEHVLPLPRCHYTSLHPDAQKRRARDIESIREMLKDCKLNYKQPQLNLGNPFFAIHDRSLDRMPTVMKRHFRGTRVAAHNPEDEDVIILDDQLTKNEVGWLVGLCSLAPLVDPAAPEHNAVDDDRADDAVCADTNPEVDETGNKVWLISGRRRQMDRLIRGPCSRVFSPMCPDETCIRAVAELSLANRLPNLRKEEFLDLVPALLAARGPDGALVSKFAVAFNVSCARWAAAYDVREEFRDNGCQLRPGT